MKTKKTNKIFIKLYYNRLIKKSIFRWNNKKIILIDIFHSSNCIFTILYFVIFQVKWTYIRVIDLEIIMEMFFEYQFFSKILFTKNEMAEKNLI